MAQLTYTAPRGLETGTQFQLYPQASEITYEGSAVSDQIVSSANTGVAHQLVAGENFLGFCAETLNNLAGTGPTIKVATYGCTKLVVTGVTAASTGSSVYASDGNTFTTSSNSSSNSYIGKVVLVLNASTGLSLVRFGGVGYRI